MWKMWIPPLVSITIILYLTAAVLFVLLYFYRDVIIIRIIFGLLCLATISLAAHYYFKYGDNDYGKREGQENQEVS